MVRHYIPEFIAVRATIVMSFLLCASLMNGHQLLGTDLVTTVVVGNPGNAPKEVSFDTGLTDLRWFKGGEFGSVSYAFRIGVTEVTNAQYAVLLNAVASTDTHSLYDFRMASDPRGGILRSGSDGSYEYSTKPLMGNKPVVFANYWNALRFTNWMHNGMPDGAQDKTTTEDGAYPLLGNTVPPVGEIITRNPNALWFIPSEDEWIKAAYHMNDGATGNYYDYPTSSNDEPLIAIADAIGDVANPGSNVANYARGADWNGLDGNLTSVGSAGSASAYGTFDQAGNVDEWTETPIGFAGDGSGGPGDLLRLIVRGGTFFQPNDFHIVGLEGASGTRDVGGPNGHVDHIGFRVATVSILGDVNHDGVVDLLDVAPFVDAIAIGMYIPEADVNQDGVVDLLDVAPFINILTA